MDGEASSRLNPAAAEFIPAAYNPTDPQIYFPYAPPPPPPSLASPAVEVYNQLSEMALSGRAVLLSLVPPYVPEAAIRAAMELFGAIRAVNMAAIGAEGVVTVHFCDVRSAQAAVAAVQEQYVQMQFQASNWGCWDQAAAAAGGLLVMQPQPPIGGCGLVGGYPVWAQFSGRELENINQGTVCVFNWDPTVSLSALGEIFQSCGDVKQVREAPGKPHKYVEFYDIRAAARAVTEINGREFWRRRIIVEFSRPSAGLLRSNSANSWSSGSSPLPPRLLRGGSDSWSPKAREFAQAPPKRNGGKKSKGGSSNCTVNPSSSQLRKGSRTVGRHSRADLRYLFQIGGEANLESGEIDPRTSVMVKNIPNKYSLDLFIKMLDSHCVTCNDLIGEGSDEPLSAFDFVYLPIDFNNKCNVGYGFVNFTSPQAALRLHKSLTSQRWTIHNSRKICEVTYARLQGLEALKEHFKNSRFACDNDDYMPVSFSPARDGRLLSEPVPVCGKMGRLTKRAMDQHNFTAAILPYEAGGASSTTASTHAPSDHGDGGDDEDEVTEGELSGSGGGGGGSDGTGGDHLSEALMGLSCS